MSDPEELDDSLAGFTVIEHDLALVGEQLEAALKGSRRAARMLRQSRRRPR